MEIIDLDDIEVEEPKLNKDQYENILDQINEVPQEEEIKRMSAQDKEFMKRVYNELHEERQPKGKHYVDQRKKKPQVVNNMDAQFPEKVKELEVIKLGNRQNKNDEPKKTVEQIKKERYMKYLEEEDNNMEISEKE